VRGRGWVMPRPTASPVRAAPRSTPRLNPPPCQSGRRPFGWSRAGSSPPASALQVMEGGKALVESALQRRGGCRGRIRASGSVATGFAVAIGGAARRELSRRRGTESGLRYAEILDNEVSLRP
jgi:hypothetical protein